MQRLRDKFKELARNNKKAFIVYIPFGFPNLELNKEIILSIQENIDILELGIPFSDPVADGPIIQEATQRALEKGATTQKLFSLLKELKGKLKIPVALMSYYNPIFRFGLENFFSQMHRLDISGIIPVDLPPEEAEDFIDKAKGYNLETIFFISPTTSLERAKKILRLSRGFVYYISVTGITGPKDIDYRHLAKEIKSLKNFSSLPICVGFGVHNPPQLKAIWQFAEGAVLGSAVVKFIKDNYQKRDFLRRLKDYLEGFKRNGMRSN